MGKIFNIGFIAILVAGATRYYVSDSLNASFLDLKLEEWEIWLYGISIVWFFIAFWNTIIRRRCPNCQSSDYSSQGSEEIDRWVGSKKVQEKVGKDTYAARNVTATFVKVESVFLCLQCEKTWSEVVKQEKN